MTFLNPPSSGSLKLSRPVKLDITLSTPKKKKQMSLAAGDLSLVETLPEALILDVPRDYCGQGQNLSLDIKTTGLGDEEVQARFEVKVLKQSFDAKTPDRDMVHLKFIQWDRAAWSRILSTLDARQAEVSKIFGALRS